MGSGLTSARTKPTAEELALAEAQLEAAYAASNRAVSRAIEEQLLLTELRIGDVVEAEADARAAAEEAAAAALAAAAAEAAARRNR